MKHNRVVIFLFVSLNLVSSKVTNYDSGNKVRCDDKNLSAKARRHFCSDYSKSESKTNQDENTEEELETNTEVTFDDYYYEDDFRRNRDSLFRPEAYLIYKTKWTELLMLWSEVQVGSTNDLSIKFCVSVCVPVRNITMDSQ